MDLRSEISQSKQPSAAESDQNKLPNVDCGIFLLNQSLFWILLIDYIILWMYWLILLIFVIDYIFFGCIGLFFLFLLLIECLDDVILVFGWCYFCYWLECLNVFWVLGYLWIRWDSQIIPWDYVNVCLDHSCGVVDCCQ